MNYRFLEALDRIVGTGRKIKKHSGEWSLYIGRPEFGFLISESDVKWWPSLEDQKAKIWEVEPKAIYVWCHCDLNSHSWIYTRNIKGTGFSKTEYAQFPTGNLFSQELKKYKLVLVED